MTAVSLPATPVVRALTPDDLPAVRDLLDRDAAAHVFVRYRVESTGLDQRLLGAGIWGWFVDDRLQSLCHAGVNLVPVSLTPQSAEAFAVRLLGSGGRPSSVIGLRADVEMLWRLLEPSFGRPRSPRWNQPFLVLDGEPPIAGDPRVRRATLGEIDTLFPACVAMFTEEVGVAPDDLGNYRARLTQLVSNGWAFALIDGGAVRFKAEVAAAAAGVCQLQGVWVDPDWRGRGLAAPALAAVIREVRDSVAPVVTLYVNDHNRAARQLYETVGFQQHATFSSVLL